jgi:hypothetical protein
MWDNVLVSPIYITDHLKGETTRNNTASSARSVVQICNTSLGLLATGDKIIYDVFIAPESASFNGVGGIWLVTYNSATGGTVTAHLSSEVDQNGVNILQADLTSYAKNQWYSRTCTVAASIAGNYLRDVYINIVNNYYNYTSTGVTGSAGVYKAYFKNIKLTDSSGTVKGWAYQSGSPSLNSPMHFGCTGTTAVVKGNRFDAYLLDNLNAVVPSKTVYWRFKGI